MLCDPVTPLTEALNTALATDLPDLAGHRPAMRDVTVDHFLQDWPNGALGFIRPGIDLMTSAYTTVVALRTGDATAVYFHGELAYVVHGPVNEAFAADLSQRMLADCGAASTRYAPVRVAEPE